MNYGEITSFLKANPGHAFVAEDGKVAYFLIGPDKKLCRAESSEKPFTEMTESEIVRAIRNAVVKGGKGVIVPKHKLN